MASRPLIVLIGPTASGKTVLAVELARMFNGEIVCADSRTIYKGMDIGTAKPTKAEMHGIPHHMLDLVMPDESFNVSQFQKLANAKIIEIQKKGKLPILVGGSGLYIDSVVFDYDFAHSHEKRDIINPRHLARDVPVQNKRLRNDTLVIGMDVDPMQLQARSRTRITGMVDSGLVNEIGALVKRYGWDLPALQAPAYRAFRDYYEGTDTLAEAEDKCVVYDRQLAKKQRTWFKRNQSIQWAKSSQETVDIVTSFLNNYI